MNILILGGTGAMGVPLSDILSKENQVEVTSRRPHASTESVKYITGNALDPLFLQRILKGKRYDAIVDFMVRGHENLKKSLPLFLDSTDQYVFISSARVYAQSDSPITEETPRLLETTTDLKFLKSNEYAIAKAKEEDMLFNSGRKNFTIIRPSITYNDNRLQLGVFEKEDWLQRALQGRSIVFSEDIVDKLTTMTHGDDVAAGIASIIGTEEALGEAFHITYPDSLKWRDVLNIYTSTLENRLGHPVKVVMTKKSTNFCFPGRKYQLIYCRYFNRTFDNSKIGKFIDVNSFKNPNDGLRESLEHFLDSPKFLYENIILEAVNDRMSGELICKDRLSSLKKRITYSLYRRGLGKFHPIITKIKDMI